MKTTPTPRTEQLADCDFHKLDDEHAEINAYNRMQNHAEELERELIYSQATIAGLKLAFDKAMAENLAMRDKLKQEQP
jgi:hypothetical protein